LSADRVAYVGVSLVMATKQFPLTFQGRIQRHVRFLLQSRIFLPFWSWCLAMQVASF